MAERTSYKEGNYVSNLMLLKNTCRPWSVKSNLARSLAKLNKEVAAEKLLKRLLLKLQTGLLSRLATKFKIEGKESDFV